MLKGSRALPHTSTRESVPILENAQDMPKLARDAEAILTGRPGAHAFLLRRHGLYTWGRDLPEAMRHVEILEFLFEVVGRSRGRD
jgi:methylthioribulose-1-phosphate dehydratase